MLTTPKIPSLLMERGGFVRRYGAWDWLVNNVGELGEVRGDDAGNFTEAKPIYASVLPAGEESFRFLTKQRGVGPATAIISFNRRDDCR